VILYLRSDSCRAESRRDAPSWKRPQNGGKLPAVPLHRYTLPPGHSVRQIECINFPSPGPIPEREKQSHLRTVLKWTAEPEMPSYARTGVKYSRNDPRILKIVISLRRRMGGVSRSPTEASHGTNSAPANVEVENLSRDILAHPVEKCVTLHSVAGAARCFKSAARFPATSILLDSAAPPALGASLTSLSIAAISSWYCFIRRSKVRRSFLQTSV
jgi:hypothetical protein